MLQPRHGSEMSTDMGMDMDMGTETHDSSSPMSMMNMYFYTSTSTPLFSSTWAPSTVGQYAGTCIFLILLAILLRSILALKTVLETRVWNTHTHHSFHGLDESAHAPKANEGIVESFQKSAMPWRLRVDGSRAVLDTVTLGIGYLLMLAVMTFNVGYFLSVLAGGFLGSLLVGRFATMGAGYC